MNQIDPNLSREEKIALLQKISSGEATPEDLKPKEMVYWVSSGEDDEPPTGLYINGKLSTDPEEVKRFWKGPMDVEITDSPFGEPCENPYAKPEAGTNDPE